MSEPRPDEQRPRATTLERSRVQILAAAKPLPSDDAALIEDLSDDEARIFLAAILEA
jgi:hypothetical protein